MLIPDSLALHAPGLCGRIVSHIEESAIYSQPQIALAAAICMLSILKAHRVRSDSNLRTNLLAVALAPSGAGKGHSMKCVGKLLSAIEHGYLLSGRPASDVGLLRSLSKTGRKLVQWDEFGLAMKNMTGTKAPSYKANILAVLMDTFSAADSLYLGDEYADGDGKRPRIDITEPCLSLFGVSTPVRFYEALNSNFVMDGFLPRLFIFEGKKDTKVSYKKYAGKERGKDSLLIGELRQTFPVFALSKLPTTKRMVTLSFAPSAMATLAGTISRYEDRKIQATIEAERAIYSRAIEHFIKLCLVLEDSKTAISYTTAGYAADLLEYIINTSLEAVKNNIFDSKQEKENNALTMIIEKAKVISRRDLVRKTQYLKGFEREQSLKDLIDAEIIETFWEVTGQERKTKTQFYRLR